VEIVETAEAYIVEADLPGVTADNVRVSVQDHRLAITGERPRSAEERTGRVHVSERPTGPFVRVIEFRVDVDGRKLRHQLENGVLRVVVPKRKAEGA
jgi:HSP20 family protein